MFSASFLTFLVLLGLAWTALAALTLTALLIRDWLRKELW